MTSRAKAFLHKFGDLIPIFKFGKRTVDRGKDFKTTKISHKCRDPKALRDFLLQKGFRKDDIRIKLSRKEGLEVSLPRELTIMEKEAIRKALEKAHKKQYEDHDGDKN